MKQLNYLRPQQRHWSVLVYLVFGLSQQDLFGWSNHLVMLFFCVFVVLSLVSPLCHTLFLSRGACCDLISNVYFWEIPKSKNENDGFSFCLNAGCLTKLLLPVCLCFLHRTKGFYLKLAGLFVVGLAVCVWGRDREQHKVEDEGVKDRESWEFICWFGLVNDSHTSL